MDSNTTATADLWSIYRLGPKKVEIERVEGEAAALEVLDLYQRDFRTTKFEMRPFTTDQGGMTQ